MVGYARLKSTCDEFLTLSLNRERYRDLLQASTSIIAMADSSAHVVSLISEVKRVVGTEYHLVANAANARQSGKGKDTFVNEFAFTVLK